MKYKIITPPAAPVISLANLREHLRVTEAAALQDGLILDWLESAREYCQHYTSRCIGVQTVEMALDAFPTAAISLAPGPVASITSINYTDSNGATQTIAPENYILDDYGLDHWALPIADTQWPTAKDSANSVRVRYVAGDLPAPVRSAMLLMVGDSFDNRGQELPKEMRTMNIGVDRLLDTIKTWTM
jgi:uncharacterized phiE125 gp8 family phage protein